MATGGLCVIVALAFHWGCATWIAHAIVDAPTRGKTNSHGAERSQEISSVSMEVEELVVAVGPPTASLSVWVIEPPAPPRGTILVLHGVRDTKRSQVATGAALATAGWRAVLVDLRGHGQSTGDWLTYGMVESQDLKQLLNVLESRGIALGRIGILGSSYGGSIGIQLAGIDTRVGAVVAVAPFANVRDLVPSYARLIGVGWLLSETKMNQGFDLAGQLAGCDLAAVDVPAAARNSSASYVLIHGRDDAHIPWQHSERISQAVPERCRLIISDGEDHVSIMQDRHGAIMSEALAFFEAHVGNDLAP